MARFKLIRYRRPSLKTALGITRAKRRFRTATGYYAATRWMRAPTNFRRRMLRRAGYYSGPMKFLRFANRVAKKRARARQTEARRLARAQLARQRAAAAATRATAFGTAPRTLSRRASAPPALRALPTTAELAARHDFATTLRAEAETRHAGHMDALNAAQRWLHSPLGAGLISVVYGIGLVVAFAADQPIVLVLTALALAVLDWHNYSTLHGWIAWRPLRVEQPGVFWVLVCVAALFFMFWPIPYLVQAFQLSGEVRQHEREQLAATIARLEAELGRDGAPLMPDSSD